MKAAGAIATTAGALLVVALLLNWWGLPPRLVDPPADAPEEISFMADAYEGHRPDLADSVQPSIEVDGFRFYEGRDLIWLVTGIASFAFGLALLLAPRVSPAITAAVAVAGAVSLALVALELISPPDFLQMLGGGGGDPIKLDYDLPVGREFGPWLALIASAGVLAGGLLALRGERSASGGH